jgi:hypothetical protein
MNISDQEKAYFVRIFIEEDYSYVRSTRRLRREHGRSTKILQKPSLYRWDQNFGNCGSVGKKKHERKNKVVFLSFLNIF